MEKEFEYYEFECGIHNKNCEGKFIAQRDKDETIMLTVVDCHAGDEGSMWVKGNEMPRIIDHLWRLLV